MKEHLQKWWLAYGGVIVALGDEVWKPMREYICTHPTVSAGAFLSIVITALVKESPINKIQ